MQHAIIITAYKNIEHLIKIATFFNYDNFKIYIHIDRKSKVSASDTEKLSQIKSIELISQKYKINWGGINHLKAILHLSEEALKDSSNEYIHLITGHDYPIKSCKNIDSFIYNNKGKEFMEVQKLPYERWPHGGLDRIEQYNFYDYLNGRSGFGRVFIALTKKLQTLIKFKRKLPKWFPPLYGGSTYWTLSSECVKYVLQHTNSNPAYLARFKYSFCSEEIFFQTLIMDSPFKHNVVNNNLRFIFWKERNGNFPANLDDSDFESLINSDALFARKFEYPVSQSLLNEVDNYLKGKQ
ncbi:hypothetical protein D0T53_06930 [Dysgonomonas sp. 216]|uniref:beta-1,6-N-acetylglucosaminyltransferase n=1 Tax=Dysgonomonas sp. 216 TaxID=2302934 RepID=UPI0013D847A1|nr:beta-1,6-N-acetylglucosaminyltransferase [Dysgonomonas sp. 216]NDW18279.1 hypothetical protein [Dysgonomonas sp. 216]NDW18647.1 hypothetical protein [Dysgonomonas sp. 216]